jgi:hypothetical protein
MKKRDRFGEIAERVILVVSMAWYIWSFMLLAVLLS